MTSDFWPNGEIDGWKSGKSYKPIPFTHYVIASTGGTSKNFGDLNLQWILHVQTMRRSPAKPADLRQYHLLYGNTMEMTFEYGYFLWDNGNVTSLAISHGISQSVDFTKTWRDVAQKGFSMSQMDWFQYPWRIHGAGILMLTWLGYMKMGSMLAFFWQHR